MIREGKPSQMLVVSKKEKQHRRLDGRRLEPISASGGDHEAQRVEHSRMRELLLVEPVRVRIRQLIDRLFQRRMQVKFAVLIVQERADGMFASSPKSRQHAGHLLDALGLYREAKVLQRQA